jgi:hypothetical protein
VATQALDLAIPWVGGLAPATLGLQALRALLGERLAPPYAAQQLILPFPAIPPLAPAGRAKDAKRQAPLL